MKNLLRDHEKDSETVWHTVKPWGEFSGLWCTDGTDIWFGDDWIWFDESIYPQAQD